MQRHWKLFDDKDLRRRDMLNSARATLRLELRGGRGLAPALGCSTCRRRRRALGGHEAASRSEAELSQSGLVAPDIFETFELVGRELGRLGGRHLGLGGLAGLCWRGFFTSLLYHVTWFVNSAAHLWGRQEYKTNDQSRARPSPLSPACPLAERPYAPVRLCACASVWPSSFPALPAPLRGCPSPFLCSLALLLCMLCCLVV